MRSFILASLVSLSAIGVYGHPSAHHAKLSRRGVDLDAFRVKVAAVYKNATAVEADPNIPTLARRANAEDIATELVKKTVPSATFRLVDDHYVGDNGVAHFYYKQTANGIDIDTADFNVNVSSLLRSKSCTSSYWNISIGFQLTLDRSVVMALFSRLVILSSLARSRLHLLSRSVTALSQRMLSRERSLF